MNNLRCKIFVNAKPAENVAAGQNVNANFVLIKNKNNFYI